MVKLSIYRSIVVPILTCGHELWPLKKKSRSQIQEPKMSFLRRVAGLSLRDRLRSSVIREELGAEPLLLRVETRQVRRLGHLFRMTPEHLPGEVYRARPTARSPGEDLGQRLFFSADLGTSWDPPGGVFLIVFNFYIATLGTTRQMITGV